MNTLESERDFVIQALKSFSKRTTVIADHIGDRRSLTSTERDELAALYASLKGDLQEAAKRGTVSSGRQAPTECEQHYFVDAVREASDELRAKTNSDPITSDWTGCLAEAENRLAYWLDRLAQDGAAASI